MSPKRILIIDDEERIREVVRACLEDLAQWYVIVAASSEEGLVKAASESPEAILLDISMPDLDGFEFLERLQANPAIQSIPVILLTAKVQPSDRSRFAQMGITGVITKPFNPVTLSTQIATILGW